MDFSKAFKRESNAVEVKYPDSTMAFRLLPKGHPDVWKVVQNKLPLSDLNKVSKMGEVGEDGSKMFEVVASQYETFGEFNEVNLRMQAAHIEGWTGLSENGEPLEYTSQKAFELLRDNDPFAEWIAEQVAILGEAYEAELAKAEDVKKK